MEQKTWQVYNFGKRNVFRSDLNESIYSLLVRVTVPLHSSLTPHSCGAHQHRKQVQQYFCSTVRQFCTCNTHSYAWSWDQFVYCIDTEFYESFVLRHFTQTVHLHFHKVHCHRISTLPSPYTFCKGANAPSCHVLNPSLSTGRCSHRS